MAEYSAFKNKKQSTITMDEEMYKRAECQLYALHTFLVEKEARAKRCRKSQKK